MDRRQFTKSVLATVPMLGLSARASANDIVQPKSLLRISNSDGDIVFECSKTQREAPISFDSFQFAAPWTYYKQVQALVGHLCVCIEHNDDMHFTIKSEDNPWTMTTMRPVYSFLINYPDVKDRDCPDAMIRVSISQFPRSKA